MSLTTDIEAVTSGQETQGQRIQQESTMVVENRILKQQMTEMCQASANGQGPPRHESQFSTHRGQYHSPEYHSYLFDLHSKIEKPAQKMAQEEMTQRVKSLEQKLKNMQGSAGQKSIAFKDLCMFPGVRLPLGFKTPKFEKYDRHGDPIAHLKRYCNQLRGVERKELKASGNMPLNGESKRLELSHPWMTTS
nr:uncharacterized protein LOC117279949 isoform X2 [Nicotiana tomentosiformis]